MVSAAPSLTARQFKDWLERLSDAEEHRRPYLARWLKLRTFYLYGTDTETIAAAEQNGVDLVRINRAFSITLSLLPRIMFRNPRIDSQPRRPGDEASAVSAGLVLNYAAEEIDIESEYELATLDALIFGYGCMKGGFDSEWGVDPVEAEARATASAVNAAAMQDIEMLRSFMGLAPVPEGGVPGSKRGSKKREAEETRNYNDSVIKEMPWCLRVSPFDLLIDPTAAGFRSAQWIAHRYIRPLKDAKEDKSYTSERLKLKGGSFLRTFETTLDRNGDGRFAMDLAPGASFAETIHSIQRDRSAGFSKTGGNSKQDQVEIWEVWDKRSGLVITLERTLEAPLRVQVKPLDVEGHPFRFLVFNHVPDRLYPKGDLEDIFPQNLELNDIRQLMLAWLRRLAKWVCAVPKGALDEKELEKLTGPETFVVLELEKQVADAINVLELGGLPPDLGAIEERLDTDIRESVGLGTEQTGEPERGVTATASSNAEAATAIRVDWKKRKFERFARDVSRMLFQIIRQFFPQAVAMRIAGPRGSEWRTITREELQREFDIRIEVDSAGKPRDEVKRAQMLEMLERGLIPMATAGVPVDLMEFARRLLLAFGIDDPDGIVPGQAGMGVPGMPPGAGVPGAMPGLPDPNGAMMTGDPLSALLGQAGAMQGGGGGVPGALAPGMPQTAGAAAQGNGRFSRALRGGPMGQGNAR